MVKGQLGVHCILGGRCKGDGPLASATLISHFSPGHEVSKANDTALCASRKRRLRSIVAHIVVLLDVNAGAPFSFSETPPPIASCLHVEDDSEAGARAKSEGRAWRTRWNWNL